MLELQLTNSSKTEEYDVVTNYVEKKTWIQFSFRYMEFDTIVMKRDFATFLRLDLQLSNSRTTEEYGGVPHTGDGESNLV